MFARRRRHLGRIGLAILLVGVLYSTTTERFTSVLLAWFSEPPLTAGPPRGERSIVLLTGGWRWRIPEAVDLQHRTGLPLIVAGANSRYYLRLLRQAGVTPLWLEGHSTDTEENAAYLSCIRDQQPIEPAFLVTDSLHMRRALGWFAHYGIAATPVSSGLPYPQVSRHPWLPSINGLRRTQAIGHEALGMVDLQIAKWTGRRVACPPGPPMQRVPDALP